MAVEISYIFQNQTNLGIGELVDPVIETFGSGFIYGGTDTTGATVVTTFVNGVYTNYAGFTGTNLALADLGFGNFVAVTQDADSVRYDLYSAGGGSYFGSIDTNFVGTSKPDVVALAGGAFVIAFEHQFNGLDYDPYLYFYNSSGVLQNTVTVDFSSSEDHDMNVVKLDNGNVAVGWVRTVGAEKEIWTAVYTSAGVMVKAPTLVDTDGLINDSLDMIATPSGYAMVYRDTDLGFHDDRVELRTFDVAGNAGLNTIISSFFDYLAPSSDPEIARLSSGQILVQISSQGPYEITASIFDHSSLEETKLFDPFFGVGHNPEIVSFGTSSLAMLSETNLSVGRVLRRLIDDDLGNTVTAGNDIAYRLDGNGGNDKLYGGIHDDVLWGGFGNDTLDGKGGNDFMEGVSGNDSYFVNSTDDVILEYFGEGTDKVTSTALVYTLSANVENLTLGSGAVEGHGNAGVNTLTGNSAVNYLYGYAGKDKLDGKGGADYMDGGDGDDTYYVDNPFDVVVEAAGDTAGKKDTVNVSYAGLFTLGVNVENGNLTGSGEQNLIGNDLANTLTSKGNTGNIHYLRGLGGKDALKGGAGTEALNGGLGSDTLTGGGGVDYFQFFDAETSANKDTIKDFSHANDEINFLASAFPGLASAAGHRLSETPELNDMFYVGDSALDAEDRIIYQKTTGNLYYDPDGVGAAAQILVAVLSNKPQDVDASDFYIF